MSIGTLTSKKKCNGDRSSDTVRIEFAKRTCLVFLVVIVHRKFLTMAYDCILFYTTYIHARPGLQQEDESSYMCVACSLKRLAWYKAIWGMQNSSTRNGKFDGRDLNCSWSYKTYSLKYIPSKADINPARNETIQYNVFLCYFKILFVIHRLKKTHRLHYYCSLSE